PELLGEDRENEVGRPLGHESQLALEAVQPALPEKAPCTDRDPGLKQVVAGAERIAVGVEEDLEPPALITVQHKWNQGDGDDGCDREGGELSGSSLPREEHPQQNGHE